MHKRLDKSNDREEVPAKRPRYNAQNGFDSNGMGLASSKNEKVEDIWGCDFGEEDIQEMDFIASQVCVEDNICDQQASAQPSQGNGNGPSTSKGGFSVKTAKRGFQFQASLQSHHFHMGKERLPNLNDLSMVSTAGDYSEFERKLMGRNAHNSTFQTNGVQESRYLEELEKLRAEKNKLIIDFHSKKEEASYLRHQLQQTQLQKAQILEEQTNQHKTELSSLAKEKNSLKTELDMMALEIGNLMERCKLLESGQLKLTEPHVVNANFLMNKSKSNASVNRTHAKHSRLQDNSVQTIPCPKSTSVLKITNLYYPLESIPETIHDLTRAEERIVDLENIGKTPQGSQMLHEQISHKVFENPDLLRPVTTRVGGRDLTIQFILQDIASLRTKCESVLEPENCIHMINKIVASARELLLNLTVALQTISRTIRSDELRDHSELYSDISVSAGCVCGAEPWYPSEKGVELRRVLGVVSHVSSTSSYLSGYIAGRTSLCTHRDESYKQYSEQMTRYCSWPKKGDKFEMLEMFLNFVSLVGEVRRSHQFSGVICAITMIIFNVHKTVGYCDNGLQYVQRIFREIVFLKPLPHCYAHLGKVMTIFVSSITHLPGLCLSKTSCTFQNILPQLHKYQDNPITRMDLVESLLGLIECMLHQNVFPLRIGRADSCNHCFELVRFVIRNLQEISETDLQFLKRTRANSEATCCLRPICSKHCRPCFKSRAKCLSKVYEGRFNQVNFWRSVKSKQLSVLNAGLVFLAHLAICDPNVETQGPEIENSLHLFMRNISLIDGIGDHLNQREAIARIRETFMADKPVRMEIEKGDKSSRRVSRNNTKPVSPFIANGRCVGAWDQRTGRRTNHDRSLATTNKLLTK